MLYLRSPIPECPEHPHGTQATEAGERAGVGVGGLERGSANRGLANELAVDRVRGFPKPFTLKQNSNMAYAYIISKFVSCVSYNVHPLTTNDPTDL